MEVVHSSAAAAASMTGDKAPWVTAHSSRCASNNPTPFPAAPVFTQALIPLFTSGAVPLTPPATELSFKPFSGHALVTGSRVDETKAPYPVYGPSQVPCSESTLAVATKVDDAEYAVGPN